MSFHHLALASNPAFFVVASAQLSDQTYEKEWKPDGTGSLTFLRVSLAALFWLSYSWLPPTYLDGTEGG
jgi:hypothetical protein